MASAKRFDIGHQVFDLLTAYIEWWHAAAEMRVGEEAADVVRRPVLSNLAERRRHIRSQPIGSRHVAIAAPFKRQLPAVFDRARHIGHGRRRKQRHYGSRKDQRFPPHRILPHIFTVSLTKHMGLPTPDFEPFPASVPAADTMRLSFFSP